MWLVSHSNNSRAIVNNGPLELLWAWTNSTECNSPTSVLHHSFSPGASWKALLMVLLWAKGQQTALITTTPPTSPGSSPLDAFPTGMQEQVVINTDSCVPSRKHWEEITLRQWKTGGTETQAGSAISEVSPDSKWCVRSSIWPTIFSLCWYYIFYLVAPTAFSLLVISHAKSLISFCGWSCHLSVNQFSAHDLLLNIYLALVKLEIKDSSFISNLFICHFFSIIAHS